jgi:hypothetical protein
MAVAASCMVDAILDATLDAVDVIKLGIASITPESAALSDVVGSNVVVVVGSNVVVVVGSDVVVVVGPNVVVVVVVGSDVVVVVGSDVVVGSGSDASRISLSSSMSGTMDVESKDIDCGCVDIIIQYLKRSIVAYFFKILLADNQVGLIRNLVFGTLLLAIKFIRLVNRRGCCCVQFQILVHCVDNLAALVPQRASHVHQVLVILNHHIRTKMPDQS